MAIRVCGEPPKRTLEPCGGLPAGFSRLRYFFGKHLSAADFDDQQRYHAGKQRFHNQRLHGAGVLCGLGLSLAESGSTVVRVVRGAALDRCGREIIVGTDQCLDVDAWYANEWRRRREEDPRSDWPHAHCERDGTLLLCVVLRYAECPTHPEPAPRDPCSCAEGGCEYGRIGERYELALMVASEARALAANDSFPSKAQIAEALADPLAPGNLLHKLAQPITQACPPPIEDAWLLLGCLTVELEQQRVDSNIPEQVLSIAVGEQGSPPVLLSTEVIQCLLEHLFADIETDVGAPAIRQVLFEKVDNGPHYRFILVLSRPVVEKTVKKDSSFRLRKLANGWDKPGSCEVTSIYADDPFHGPCIKVTVDNTEGYLEAGARYHLFLDKDSVLEPIVDRKLRILRPRDFVHRFELRQNAAMDLEMTVPN